MDEPITDKENFPSSDAPRTIHVPVEVVSSYAYAQGRSEGYCEAVRDMLIGVSTIACTIIFLGLLFNRRD
jgi:hypothetical protein